MKPVRQVVGGLMPHRPDKARVRARPALGSTKCAADPSRARAAKNPQDKPKPNVTAAVKDRKCPKRGV